MLQHGVQVAVAVSFLRLSGHVRQVSPLGLLSFSKARPVSLVEKRIQFSLKPCAHPPSLLQIPSLLVFGRAARHPYITRKCALNPHTA